MRKLFLTAILVAVCASLSVAQDRPKGEFFGGYSVNSVESSIDTPGFVALGLNRNNQNNFDPDRRNLSGFNVAGTGYLNERFGLTGDFSAHFNSFENNTTGTTSGQNNNLNSRTEKSLYNFLGGPQFKYRSDTSRVEPFARALFGVAVTRNEFRQTGTLAGTAGTNVNTTITDNSSDFAMGIGGGIDVRVGERVAIRAIQVDYNPIFQRDRTINNINLNGERQDNVRFSFGIVF